MALGRAQTPEDVAAFVWRHLLPARLRWIQ
jgi:hypothetical protein